MTYEEIEKLAEQYQEALAEDLTASAELDEAENGLKASERVAIALAYEIDAISGKNADERKAAEARYLEGNSAIREARAVVRTLKVRAIAAKANSEYFRSLIGLTKAWLYSQSERE